LEGLENLNVSKEKVKYVILTHIHLDHGGGAGLLLKSLPNAQLVVHSRGERHMVNPKFLIEGVKQVYGEKKYDELYGEIISVDQQRVKSVNTKETLVVGKRTLDLMDSPGHAKHHLFIYDSKTNSVFSGDAFGLAYPFLSYNKFRLVFPSTSPTQFEPEQALATYKRIIDLKPDRILFTHFGSVENVQGAYSQVLEWTNFSVEIAVKRYQEGYRQLDLHNQLLQDIKHHFDEVISRVRGSGLTKEEEEFLALDIELNAQGLVHYMNKRNPE
jgi:glyoxylase-like metal-dependent hydrolase (beta-lactamase superfamily II)